MKIEYYILLEMTGTTTTNDDASKQSWRSWTWDQHPPRNRKWNFGQLLKLWNQETLKPRSQDTWKPTKQENQSTLKPRNQQNNKNKTPKQKQTTKNSRNQEIKKPRNQENCSFWLKGNPQPLSPPPPTPHPSSPTPPRHEGPRLEARNWLTKRIFCRIALLRFENSIRIAWIMAFQNCFECGKNWIAWNCLDQCFSELLRIECELQTT